MRRWKLLVLGAFALAVAGGAGAEDAADEAGALAPAPAAAADAEPAAQVPPVVEALEEAAEADALAEAQPEAEPTAELPSAELTLMDADPEQADPWADALPAAADSGAAAEPAAPARDSVTLGAVGYDADGREGRIHLVVRGDTLWDISDAYLGSAWVWPSIWQDNRDIENPHLIFPGDRIWITDSVMRRVTAEEAEQLLAGQPAALGDEVEEPFEAPPPPAPPAPRTQRISSRESMGFVSADEVDSAASIVDAVVERVMLSQGDAVYIGLGEDEVDAGDEFTVFRVDEKVYDPDNGDLLGYHVNVLGWLEVEKPSPESSLATIRRSLGEMERGDLLVRREPPVLDIPVLDPPAGVEGRISFFPHSRTLTAHVD